MPGPKVVITVKGSFELSDLCDREFHKMAQNFDTTANYAEKAKKRAHRRRQATRRTCRGARGKEITSRNGGRRQRHKRRRENCDIASVEKSRK
jgi:hypothetical protein